MVARREDPQYARSVRPWLAALVLLGCAEDPPAPREPWTQLELPDRERRLEPAVAALGTELVVAGGYETGLTEGLAITDEVLVLDTLDGTWRSLPPAPVRWTHAQLAAIGGSLYLLGGHEDPDGTASGRAFVLPPGGAAWEELPPMPSPRGAAAVIVSRPFIFLFGGADATGPLASVLAFDILDRTWVADALPPLPTPRSHAAVMEQVDGTFIVAGGLGISNQPLGDVWRLRPTPDPADLAWAPAEAMPSNRGGCVFGTAYGALVCAGGEAGAAALDVVERFDPDGLVVDGMAVGEWRALPAMPEARAGAQGAMIGGQLYVVGGSRSLMYEPTSTVFVFAFVDSIDG